MRRRKAMASIAAVAPIYIGEIGGVVANSLGESELVVFMV